jgi:hypothetical protein
MPIKLGDNYILFPVDTTGNRPSSSAGLIRYNSSIGTFEGYDTISTWRAMGGILHTHHFEDATRNISLSNGSTGTCLTFTFTKKFANSYLVAKGRAPHAGQYSYQTGEYLEIDGVRKYEAANYISPWDTDLDSRYGQCTLNGMWTTITTTGSKTVTYGWSLANGSTGERPGSYVNPDQLGARTRARTTIIDIFEIDPSVVTSIT